MAAPFHYIMFPTELNRSSQAAPAHPPFHPKQQLASFSSDRINAALSFQITHPVIAHRYCDITIISKYQVSVLISGGT